MIVNTKLTLLLFSLFIFSLSSFSQPTLSRSGNPSLPESLDGLRLFPCGGEDIFEENFEGGSIPATWQTFDFDGLAPFDSIQDNIQAGWQYITDFKNPLNHSLASPSWYKDTVGTSDDWLISPQITIEGNVCLSWFAYSQDRDFPEDYEVRISTTSNDTSAFFDNAPLLQVFGESDRLNYRSVNLADYSGQSIYLAFRHISTDKFILVLDDIRLARIPSQDIAPFDVRFVPENDTTNRQFIKGAIRNFGSDTLKENSVIQVSYSVDGFTPQITVVDTFVLAPNDTIQFVHEVPWDAPLRGSFEVCVWTSGVPDNFPSNDTLCQTVSFGPVVTDVNGLLQAEIQLFPNPVKDVLRFQIETQRPIQLQSISLLNVLGREVYYLSKPKASGHLNLSSLAPGMYWIRIKGEHGAAFVKSILKQ